MEIAELAPKTVEYNVPHPVTNEPTGLVLTLGHIDHPEISKRIEELYRAAYKSAAGGEDVSMLDYAYEYVLGWSWPEGFTLRGKATPKCTPTTRKHLFEDLPQLRRLIMAKIGDRESFFSAGAK